MIIFKYLVIGSFPALAKWLYPLYFNSDEIKNANDLVNSQSVTGYNDLFSLKNNVKELKGKNNSGLVVCTSWFIVSSFLPVAIIFTDGSIALIDLDVDIPLKILAYVVFILNGVFYHLECIKKFKKFEKTIKKGKGRIKIIEESGT
jgi:hypothetical protein